MSKKYTANIVLFLINLPGRQFKGLEILLPCTETQSGSALYRISTLRISPFRVLPSPQHQ